MCLQKETRKLVCIARLLAGEARGQQLVEAALILPVFLMLLIGTVWMGRAFNIYETVCRAAREGAEVALAPSCATCGAAAASDGQVIIVVDNILSSASIDTTNPGLSIQINRGQVLNPTAPTYYRASGVAVSVSYPMQLTVPFTALNATTVNISTTVRMLQEF
jgi:hypothetical protein